MSAASAAARTSAPLTREPVPATLVRDADALRAPRTRLAAERPVSIRDAIVRWLEQEL
jgi:hypothetical protein